MLKPRQPTSELEVATVGSGHWSLSNQHPERFSLVVFYRGYHCPVCRGYLKQLDRLLDKFASLGVNSVIAVSGDTEELAKRTAQEWDLGGLTLGYGQSVDSMRAWGLFISKGIKEGEPEEFGEPGLFLIRSDGTLYASVLNSMPFGRPHLDEVVSSINWINDHNYPARGEA